MVERYSRNESKAANDDIAEVVYHVADEHTSVTCHREDSKISATTRDFVKPSLTADKGASGITWDVDSYEAFLVRYVTKYCTGPTAPGSGAVFRQTPFQNTKISTTYTFHHSLECVIVQV